MSVPQTHLIREYFRSANSIDIHNQYRQGLLAIERTWKTKSWVTRIFQTVMGMTLVNGYLAFKYITEKEPTLREFTNGVELAMCAKVVEEGRVHASVAASTRGARAARQAQEASRADPGELPHTLFNGKALKLGGKKGVGVCKICGNNLNHAAGVCKTCSTGLETDNRKPFWVCYAGKHGRQCYRQHLHHVLHV